VRLHLCGGLDYQGKLVRFIENHDEPRARSAFSPEKERAAAVVIATIPGAKLFHDGQLEGRKVRLPVFLRRRPAKPADPELGVFYRTLLRVASSDRLRNGRWQQCERTGWPDNASYQNLIAWCWRNTKERHLIIVNFSASAAQALVLLPWDDLRGRKWRIYDIFTQNDYERSGDVMRTRGLYVDLTPWGYHVLT
jgi:hypothetical protein